MKTVIYLLITAHICNGAYLGAFGGGGGGSNKDNFIAYSVNKHGHTYQLKHNDVLVSSSSPVITKVILETGRTVHKRSPDYSPSNGYSYGAPSNGNAVKSKMFNVIIENYEGRSNGHSAGSASGASRGLQSYNSHLYTILPQILEIVLQKDNNRGSQSGMFADDNDISKQLLATYGKMGSAVVNRIKDNYKNSFYSGGRVIQRGVLKRTHIEEISDHGPPDHGQSAHKSGW